MVAIAVVHASGTGSLINLPGDQIWAMWVALLLGGALFWGAIRRWQRRGTDGAAGGLFLA